MEDSEKLRPQRRRRSRDMVVTQGKYKEASRRADASRGGKSGSGIAGSQPISGQEPWILL